jgi:serine protease Do
MIKKYVFAAVLLVAVGIIVGAILVSSVGSGVDLGFAIGSDDVKLGGEAPIAVQNQAVKALSDNFAAVSKAVSPSVVAIKTTTTGKERPNRMPRDFWHFFGPDLQNPNQEPEPSQGFGSGVIVSADGYIATNNHVVEGAADGGIEVILNDKVYYKAKLIGTDPSTDLAVIKVEGKGLVPAALGNSENIQVGEWVVAIGNPLGLTSTVTAGIISAVGRNINIIQDAYGIESFIQTDAAINPGNSGGALVNMNGEVIGINTAIATTNARYQGYGFAVPVNILKTVAADIIKYGEVRRGYIGVTIGAVDQTMADALGLKEVKGIIVQELVADGAAKAAGIREGDVILTVDGREVNKQNELQSYIATRHPGDEVILKIFRDGKTFEKKVTLKPRKQNVEIARNEEDRPSETEKTSDSPQTVKFDNLGFGVRVTTSAEAKALNIEKGVIVSDVKPYSEAANRAIRKDDIILEADRKPVNAPGDLKRIVESRKSGESILLRLKRDNTTAFVALQIP